MSGSQKTLRVFGILEIVSAALYVIEIVQGGSASSWVSVATSAVTAYFLLAAAKDASWIRPAWMITLVFLALSILEAIMAVTVSGDTTELYSAAIWAALNLIVFVAANNVKKQQG